MKANYRYLIAGTIGVACATSIPFVRQCLGDGNDHFAAGIDAGGCAACGSFAGATGPVSSDVNHVDPGALSMSAPSARLSMPAPGQQKLTYEQTHQQQLQNSLNYIRSQAVQSGPGITPNAAAVTNVVTNAAIGAAGGFARGGPAGAARGALANAAIAEARRQMTGTTPFDNLGVYTQKELDAAAAYVQHSGPEEQQRLIDATREAVQDAVNQDTREPHR